MILIDVLKNPDIFEALSMGDKIQTVLWGLAAIVVIVFLLRAILKAIGNKGGEEAKQEAAQTVAPAAAATTAAEGGESLADEALIAVIAAAIAAYEGTEVVNNLVVRKIVRIPGPDPIWSALGRQESLQSRRV